MPEYAIIAKDGGEILHHSNDQPDNREDREELPCRDRRAAYRRCLRRRHVGFVRGRAGPNVPRLMNASTEHGILE